MKKIILLFSILFIIGKSYSAPVINGNYTNEDNTKKTKIVLINPGVFYLESIVYMTNNGIINDENIEYLAVFYTKSEIKYSEAKNFVEKNNIKFIKFKEIYGNLDINNIYKKNECTDDFRDVFQNSDGIIFFGGWDIPSVYYGQKTELTVGIKTPNRHLFELSFLFHLLGGSQNDGFNNLLEKNPNYPVMGICLGMQTLNVATGGDMYQDIPSNIYGINYVEDVIDLGSDQMHRNYNKHLYPEAEINNHSFHHVKIINKELRKKLKLKNEFNPMVASSHHQAVKNLGKNIKVAATSMDGKVIEMIIHKKYPNVIAPQFHPEFIYLHDPDSKKRKFHPDEKEMLTEHEILVKNNSYQFHLDFWELFIKSVKTFDELNTIN
ncbi:MAG: gamma-glutamyl-gamma-aminobutyrate hydrolase family protein [Bacteroidota bacterium]